MLTEKTSSASSASSASSSAPVGQAFYGTGSGNYTWTCPEGVKSVCVVAIGGGASNQGTSSGYGGGGGGGLGWKNDIPVTAGDTYAVGVGQGGEYGTSGDTNFAGESFFISASVVQGGGASGYTGGTYVGEGGGNGGDGASSNSGGGAGGYTGNGGNRQNNGSGGGGAGGGYYSSTYGWPSGGGVGPFGQGDSGVLPSPYGGGGGGSGGENGSCAQNPYMSRGLYDCHGGLYGGGSGGAGDNDNNQVLQRGGRGCVRIIWGANRSFPSTGTGDM